MAVADNKDRIMVTLEKSIKHKLEVLAGADNKKVGAYIAVLLEQNIKEAEQYLLDEYEEGFLEAYESVFGNEYMPIIQYERKPIDVLKEEFLFKGAPRHKGRVVGKAASREEEGGE